VVVIWSSWEQDQTYIQLNQLIDGTNLWNFHSNEVSTMTKKIAILGTGANGSCAAANLTCAGLDVVLIDQWPDHVEAMRTNGLRIETQEDVKVVRDLRAFHLCDVATFTEKFDIVMLMTKAYDALWMAELIKPHLAEDGLLIGAQNSTTAEDLAEIVGINRSIGCVVELSSQLFTPGVVQRNTPPERTWFALGALDSSMEHRVKEVVEIFQHIGKVTISDDILSAKWMKLIVNSMTMAIRSIMGMTSGQIAEIPGVRDLILRAGAEALSTGQASGYKIVPIFGLSTEQVEGSNRLLETLIDKLRADVRIETKNAMYQDVLKGRQTEIDMLNGLVCELGQRHGVPTPVNDVLVDITHQVMAGDLKPEANNFERVLVALEAAR